MTPSDQIRYVLRELFQPPRVQRRTTAKLAVAAGLVAFALTAVLAMAPPAPPSAAAQLQAYVDAHSQTVKHTATPRTASLTRDGYSASPGVDTLVAHGTNYDWARLVMLYGGWPQSEQNVTVMVRWMRQENGADNWWNRNNPMNNGYGSGGGGGTGSYANLKIAAQMAAENLHHNPGFAGIVAGLAAGNSSSATESAIWASPWASGHYGNGSRWHYTPVDEVTAPPSAW